MFLAPHSGVFLKLCVVYSHNWLVVHKSLPFSNSYRGIKYFVARVRDYSLTQLPNS